MNLHYNAGVMLIMTTTYRHAVNETDGGHAMQSCVLIDGILECGT